MIIDRLLERKNGEAYKAKAFYDYCMQWQCGRKIAEAMDKGTNNDVAIAIIDYLTAETNDVASSLVQFVIKSNWLKPDRGYLIYRLYKTDKGEHKIEYLTRAPVTPIWSSDYSVATVFTTQAKVTEALNQYNLQKELHTAVFIAKNF